ncbi:MAG: succinate--CoA ligase subunit alpha [Candidatus Lokiarchaeota archaeon]|nr:succinate--CoA ligase subunit alpha [Candidatus Lokiarchaeota archaeon]
MILANKNTKILVQGITGNQGSFHSKIMKDYGSKIVAGTSKSLKKEEVHKIPIYKSIKDAKNEHEVNATIIFVPARFSKDAILEAINENIELIVIITEGLPILDEMFVINEALKKKLKIIGPNSPGILTPEVCKLGIIPHQYFKKGSMGLVSRSGTLTYEIAYNMHAHGISTAVGIGGDPIIGLDFIEILRLFENDSQTKAIIMIGEIGGIREERAAKFIKNEMSKPIFAFIAGSSITISGKRFGHAGALIVGNKGTARSKIEALKKAGVHVVNLPYQISEKISEIL